MENTHFFTKGMCSNDFGENIYPRIFMIGLKPIHNVELTKVYLANKFEEEYVSGRSSLY